MRKQETQGRQKAWGPQCRLEGGGGPGLNTSTCEVPDEFPSHGTAFAGYMQTVFKVFSIASHLGKDAEHSMTQHCTKTKLSERMACWKQLNPVPLLKFSISFSSFSSFLEVANEMKLVTEVRSVHFESALP